MESRRKAPYVISSTTLCLGDNLFTVMENTEDERSFLHEYFMMTPNHAVAHVTSALA